MGGLQGRTYTIAKWVPLNLALAALRAHIHLNSFESFWIRFDPFDALYSPVLIHFLHRPDQPPRYGGDECPLNGAESVYSYVGASMDDLAARF